MFIDWEVKGHPIYPSMESGQTIAYISDIGAFGLKPLFITGSVITTVSLDLGLMADRWLRHMGRLAPNTSLTQKALSIIAIVLAVAGACGLILLSIFDTYHHSRLHDGLLLLFILGYILSAIFLCAEYQRLGIHYRNHRSLRISFWAKLTFIIVEILLAIVFASTSYTHHRNVAAVIEWVIALIFTFYVLSFLLDLLPSVRTKHHVPQGYNSDIQDMIEKGTRRHRRGDGQYETPLTNDSAGNNGPVANRHSAGHFYPGRQSRRGLRWLHF